MVEVKQKGGREKEGSNNALCRGITAKPSERFLEKNREREIIVEIQGKASPCRVSEKAN